MSEPAPSPVEIVRGLLEAFDRGDYEASLAAYAPDVEGDFTHMPDGRIVHGPEGIREEVSRWVSTWLDFQTEWEGIAEAGDTVVVLVRQWGTGRTSGAPMEIRYGQVFTVRDGAVVAMKTYLDPEQAIEDGGVDPRQRR
jgi:ketosteroid isomerase-like protein